ncbi:MULTISPECIES: hypothetical protein [Spirulina sp. CCY15215]|uniref:hypothetical protein n=1 Tax=Spirulina sp. CCY15215 TaxID=2767591 RepID=UPI0019509DBD|nr:hypothetical protein [Spirulina major]
MKMRSPSLGKIVLTLGISFSLGGSIGLGSSAIAPQSALAYTDMTTIELYRLAGESFPVLLRRAEIVARAAAQRSFDRDILVTSVAIDVVGKHNGEIAPLLRLQINRQTWQSQPDPQLWATYFPNTPFLLGIEQ